ncbi:MAG: DUF86 domain-containing protein [Chloroflexi bacterium]|nr:DUF86 domain-containing protein [Chloroflexota bacterium]
MVDDSIQARLNLLDEYVSDLRETRPTSFAAYESDKMLRRYVERMLHMAIDACVHIGISLLTAQGFRNPENYHDVFVVLGEHAVLPRELVDCMTAMVEFRNLLVYDHASVDDAMVYGFARKRLDDLVEFSNAARSYLTGRASNGLTDPAPEA